MDLKTEYAGIWRRFSAPLINELFCIFALLLVAYTPAFLLDPQLVVSNRMIGWWLLVSVLSMLLLDLYFRIYCVSKYGGTPGDMILGMRVRGDVDVDSFENQVTFKQALRRASVYLAINWFSALVELWFLLARGQVNGESVASPSQIGVALTSFIELEIPFFSTFMMAVSISWLAAEMISILGDYKKRAISDRMGSTVVVRA